ncbi:MAG TPA: nickel pincer cofactor biosynthesis protein LarC [Terriglobales bacterium]|nr:nickel pincer cofactor biosynthesis protein LarC [Terriglobales bacterium]
MPFPIMKVLAPAFASTMRIAYLDCFSGISGDMFLGALLDAGVRPELLEETVAELNIGARLEISRVHRSGISATKVDVYSHGEKDLPREEYIKQRDQHAHQHSPEHTHDHSHDQGHQDHVGHGHEHSHARHHQHDEHIHGRGLNEIREIIQRSRISETAKATAIAIFENLGAAEAKIHNVPIETVHFHEVGAVDAMVDIVCAAVGAESLNVDEWVCSPLNVGSGTVVCAHGTLPIPAPATIELLKGAPVYSSGPQAELVTPTGAAIAKTLVRRFGTVPAMKIEKTGYGAGTRDFSGYPNVMRITIGEAQPGAGVEATQAGAHLIEETITVLEANLDDLNPQVFGYVIDRALAEGALEAFGTPLLMKKNRPGMLLTLLARPQDADRLARLIFDETTTLGVRRRDERRQALNRRWVDVQTQWGKVRMKIGSLNGTVTNYSPEYEDCRHIAAQQHLPLKSVMQEAIRIYLGTSHNEQHG